MADRHPGVATYSVMVETETGDMTSPILIVSFGDIPPLEEMSPLWRIFEAMSDPDFEYLIVDCTVVRAHQHPAGAKKGGLKIKLLVARGSLWRARAALQLEPHLQLLQAIQAVHDPVVFLDQHQLNLHLLGDDAQQGPEILMGPLPRARGSV